MSREDECKSHEIYDWERKPRSLNGIIDDAPKNWGVSRYFFREKVEYKGKIGQVLGIGEHTDREEWKFITKDDEKELVKFYNECSDFEKFRSFIQKYPDISGGVEKYQSDVLRKWWLQEKWRGRNFRLKMKALGYNTLKDVIENYYPEDEKS